jgi:hypothetical protein
MILGHQTNEVLAFYILNSDKFFMHFNGILATQRQPRSYSKK